MPRTATIGPEIYRRVNALVGEGKRRAEAFALVAEERGSTSGAVSANYYRVARAEGVPSGRRRRRVGTGIRAQARRRPAAPKAGGSARARTVQRSDADIAQLAGEIARLTERLVRQVAERDRKIRALIG
jgi:hypothetical protein